MEKNFLTEEENKLIIKTFDKLYPVCDFESKILEVIEIIKNKRLINGEDLNKGYNEIYIKRIGLMKQIIDEAFPIAKFCDLFFDKNKNIVCVKYVIGNQPYDAQIEYKATQEKNIKYIELASIEEDIYEINNNSKKDINQITNEYSIRNLLHENKDGIIGLTINKSKTSEIFEANFIRVLKKKLQKSKTYPPDTALIIYLKSVIYNSDDFCWDFLDNIKTTDESNIKNFSMILVFNNRKILHAINLH